MGEAGASRSLRSAAVERGEQRLGPAKEAVDRDFGDLRSLQSLIILHAEQGLSETTGGAKNLGATLNSMAKAIAKPSVARSAPLDGKHEVIPDYISRLCGSINNSSSNVPGPSPKIIIVSIGIS